MYVQILSRYQKKFIAKCISMDDDFFFDEEVDVETELTPEEAAQEIQELSAMEAQELALEALRQEREEQRGKILKDYRKGWQEKYGVDRDKPTMWQLGRERELRQRYGMKAEDIGRRAPEQMLEEARTTFEKRQADLRPERASRRIQQAARKSFLCAPCKNLSEEEIRTLDPLRIIRLRVQDERGDIKCLCYDVVALYDTLKNTYGVMGYDSLKWRDPTTGIRYTQSQAKRIKNLWARVRPEGAARVHLETELALSRQPSPEFLKIEH